MKRAPHPFLSWTAVSCACILLAAATGETSPANLEILLSKGYQLYNTYDQDPASLDEAIRCYKEALSLDPDNYTILWTLAEMFQCKGQVLDPKQREERMAVWDEGAEYGKRALEVNPAGKEGHYYYMANYGAAAQLRGLLNSIWKFRRIKKALDRTYELDPDWPPVLVAKAQYMTEMPGIFGGSDEEAEKLYRRAMQLDPHCSIAHYFLAEFLVRNKRYGEAVSCLQALIDCPNPDNRANWVMVDVPMATKLLQRIHTEMGTSKKMEPQ